MRRKLFMRFAIGAVVLASTVIAAAKALAADDADVTSGSEKSAVTATKPVIFVCGDSTSKNSGRGKNGNPVAGWGTPIAAFFDSE
jgi:hypothetical protein